MKSLFWRSFCALSFVLTLPLAIGCTNGDATSGATTTGTESSVTVTSLEQLPDVEDMATGAATSTSLSARFAVSGAENVTPVKEITDDLAQSLFWGDANADGVFTDTGNMIDAINDGTLSINSETIGAYWEGEGRCRTNQMFGYAMQNAQQGGTSLCYMKNVPQATSGAEIVSGDATPETLFDQGTDTQVVEVQIANINLIDPEAEGAGETIFIRNYGSSTTEGASGPAFDLWFCLEGQTTPSGYEEIRIDGDSITLTSGNTGFGNYTSEIAGTLAEDSSGDIVYDPEAAQAFSYSFSDSSGFLGKGQLNILGDTLTASEWFSFTDEGGNDNESQSYATTTYSGDGDEVALLTAGVKVQWGNGSESTDTYVSGMEWWDSLYVSLNSGTAYDAANEIDLSAGFWSGTLEVDPDLLNAVSNFSCSQIPDVVVSMDFADGGIQAVAALCESDFTDMNFCDSTAIQQARGEILQAEFNPGDEGGDGSMSCSTSSECDSLTYCQDGTCAAKVAPGGSCAALAADACAAGGSCVSGTCPVP